MSLSFDFNDNTYRAGRHGDHILYVVSPGAVFFYDFAARIMYGTIGSSIGYGVTPFSQLDREVLIAMRDKLVDLGGKPPELPDEPASAALPARKFNL